MLALLMAAPLTWAQAAQPVGSAKTSSASNSSKAPGQAQPSAKPKLNLYIGQAKDLLSNTQWARLMATQPINLEDSDSSAPEPDVVEVKGERAAPEVPDGIASVFWALRHPVQAWRVLAPAK
jgi:hypothetical protein